MVITDADHVEIADRLQERAEQKRKLIKEADYVIKYTAKKRFARLHLRDGCWYALDERDMVPVFDLDEARYDGICHICWPKGTRPISEKQQGDKATTVKTIRTAAGLPVDDPDEESSTAESSSSGDTESETECNVQDQGIGRDFVMVDPAV